MTIPNMTDISLSNKKVFFRADLNVPVNKNGEITDDSRVKATMPGISYALNAGAALMVTSHLGRPKEGKWEKKYSLLGIANLLAARLGKPVRLIENWFDGFNVMPGEMVVLENCRFNTGEKINDITLSRKIAGLCDIYVNDAFASAHRTESTTVGAANYAKVACAGPLMLEEIRALSRALNNPKKPLVAIVGGSKVSTKLPVLYRLADLVDHLIVGGGIANTFLFAHGVSVGRSLVEEELGNRALEIVKKIKEKGGSCPLPEDVLCSQEIDENASVEIKNVEKILDYEMILDIGPKTIEKYKKILTKAGTIVWNGPLGVFELDQFANGTKNVAESIESSQAFSIAGGGDTLAAINKFGTKKVDYISTAGGAFLEFLEGKTLPALAALNSRGREGALK